MSRVLEETGCPVPSSDLYQRGYGEAGHDFLSSQRSADNIVTNPPYNCAEGFVASGVKHARHKFALLLRLAFLEGAHRANTIFARIPPTRVWVFSERITFYRLSATAGRAPGRRGSCRASSCVRPSSPSAWSPISGVPPYRTAVHDGRYRTSAGERQGGKRGSTGIIHSLAGRRRTIAGTGFLETRTGCNRSKSPRLEQPASKTSATKRRPRLASNDGGFAP
jgi:hypothetical protein